MFWYCLLLYVVLLGCSTSSDAERSLYSLDIRMPNVSSSAPDALICTSLAVDATRNTYVLEYIPHATSKVAHHMMLYGCGNPGSRKASWSCGEMSDQSEDSVCGDGQRQVVYAWANDAPTKKLPPGVGFRLGKDSMVKYLVLQLHYREKSEAGRTDQSGLTLRLTEQAQRMQLGFYILATNGFIPPQQPDYHMETACVYDYEDTIIPLGYRTHAHSLGVVISGYLVRNTSAEDEAWTELGRMSPQRAQMFYDVNTKGLAISKGDILAARCTMNSTGRKHATVIGETNKDEMCNFYLMFATDNKATLKLRSCVRDAQRFRWDMYFKHIPQSASSLPQH